MLVADKKNPAATSSLESQVGRASPSLCPLSAVVSSPVLLCLPASLSLICPPLDTDIGGTTGSSWPTTHNGGNGATHLPGSCSPPQELPRPHQDEGGFPEGDCSSGGDVSQGRELHSPRELGYGEGLSFPRQHRTGCSPGQRSKRWPKDLGHPAKRSCLSQLLSVLKHQPWISPVVSWSFTPGVQVLPLQHVTFLLLLRHQQFSGF